MDLTLAGRTPIFISKSFWIMLRKLIWLFKEPRNTLVWPTLFYKNIPPYIGTWVTTDVVTH